MLERARPDLADVVVALRRAAPLLDMPPFVMLREAPLLGVPLGVALVLVPTVLVPLVALVSLVALALPLDIPDDAPFTLVVLELLSRGVVRFRSTSPPAVPVTPLRCTVPLAGMQFVELMPFDSATFVPVPVPFAPLVVFRPVKR